MNSLNWVITNTEKNYERWNQFVLNDPNSSFHQLSTWLDSYLSYGFKWELLLLLDGKNEIICGSANIIVELPIFRMYICSYGPTNAMRNCHPSIHDEWLSQFLERSKLIHAFAAQVTLPKIVNSIYKEKCIEGRIFPKIASNTQINVIQLYEHYHKLTEEEIITSFTPKGRRDVRASYRRNLTSRFATSDHEIQKAYQCFKNNSEMKGYAIREWKDIKDSLIESVRKQFAFIVTAWLDDRIQGAILLERSANRLTYCMGGVYRHSPDLLTGYFLQMEGIKLAISLDLMYYDISYGGPDKVRDFKQAFNPQLVHHGETVYFINNKFKHLLFRNLYERLKTYIPILLKLWKIILRK